MAGLLAAPLSAPQSVVAEPELVAFQTPRPDRVAGDGARPGHLHDGTCDGEAPRDAELPRWVFAIWRLVVGQDDGTAAGESQASLWLSSAPLDIPAAYTRRRSTHAFASKRSSRSRTNPTSSMLALAA